MVAAPIATLAEAPVLGTQIAQASTAATTAATSVPLKATPRTAAAPITSGASTARGPLQAFLATLRSRSSATVGTPTCTAVDGRSRKAAGRRPAPARASDASAPAEALPSSRGPHGGPTPGIPSHGLGAPTRATPAALPRKVAARLVSAPPIRPLPIGLLATPSGPTEDVPAAGRASRLTTTVVLLATVRPASSTVVAVAEAGNAPTGLHCADRESIVLGRLDRQDENPRGSKGHPCRHAETICHSISAN